MGQKRNLIIVRHGQSEWNKKNLFTGWKNPGLTPLGYEEADNAGVAIKKTEIVFDVMFTSDLKRAQITGTNILKQINQEDLVTIKSQALNERDYGSLSGLNKDDAREKWGEEQVHIWRRSYDTPPPDGESLRNTAERVLPYFNDLIMPEILLGKNVLIAAHGNSLRALIMQLDSMSEEDIVKLEIPTGAPIHYRFNEDGSVTFRKDLHEK
ncbi:MAG: 2,3-bisphosphoglycerate-dependent phosphoglycerate mutase [Gammaproteobacteria bacterium]